MSGVPSPETVSSTVPETSERMLLCDAGGCWVALPLRTVLEVVPARPLTRLPGASREVAGLANLRGQIVTVVDLAARLGRTPAAGTAGHRLVVVEHRGRSIGLAVRDVVRIVQPGPDELRPATEDGEESFVRATGEVEHRPFQVLDTDALLQSILV